MNINDGCFFIMMLFLLSLFKGYPLFILLYYFFNIQNIKIFLDKLKILNQTQNMHINFLIDFAHLCF